MNKVLKEKIKNIILTKDTYSPEETKLILWYLKEEKESAFDSILNCIKKVINLINENIKDGEE